MPVVQQQQQQQQQQQASLSFNNNSSSSKGGIINRYHASRNLREEWRRAFFKAMELDYDSWHDDNDNNDNDKAKSSTSAAVGSGSGGNKKKTNVKMTLISLIPERTGSKNNTDENNNNSNSNDDNEDDNDDPWTATAREIHSNLSRMACWIQEKKWDYASVHMTNDEASLIQSTVTSFTATTANEIESLRKMVSSSSSSGGTNNRDLAQHKQGIVQILLEQLKVLVAEPFGRLQKQRSRAAVRIWQNPLQCKLEPPGGNGGQTVRTTTDEHAELDAALGFVDDGGARTDPLEKLRFYPTKPILRLQQNFERSYGLVEGETAVPQALVPRPKSRFRELVKKNKKRSLGVLETTESDKEEIDGDDGQEDSSNKMSTKRSRPNGSSPGRAEAVRQQHHYRKPILPVVPTPDQQQDYDPYYTTTSEAALEDESALLTALLQNSDLDSIQKMEESMVQITTLLSQFSDLVTEQQEHVSDIQDATRQAKSNVEKGQEELVSATERTQESRHYTATAIFAMGMLLLLFHWLRP